MCKTTEQGGAPAGNGHLGQGSPLTSGARGLDWVRREVTSSERQGQQHWG